MFEVNAKAANAFDASSISYFDYLKSFDYPKYSFFEVTNDGIKELKSTEIEFANVVAVPRAKLDLFPNLLHD